VPKNQGIPRCTCFLFVGAITCHTMVLIGNITTAQMVNGLGKSASGWGSVASSVSHSLDTELNPAMLQVTQWLTTSIDAIKEFQHGVDTLLNVAGSTIDGTVKFYDPKKVDEQSFKANAKQHIQVVAQKALVKVQPLTHKVMESLQPALAQVGDWLESFSAKIQDTLEEFGTVTDRSQKLVDQVMGQVASSGGMYEEMVWDTYHMFDPFDDGISLTELHNAADQYGISALQGEKAAHLMETYDTSGDGSIGINEYEQLVTDPSLPGLMTTILRNYAKKLGGIASSLGAAKMRAEVATVIVEYLTLVCTKNLTKVGWISGDLVNGELPLEFTADLFYEFYQAKMSPNNLSPIDVGSMILNYTVKDNPKHTVAAVDLLASPDFFASEGFDISIEDETIFQVVSWLEMSKEGQDALKRYAEIKPQPGQSYAETYRDTVIQREQKYTALHGTQNVEFQAQSSQTLRDVLLGGSAASSAADDPQAQAASGSSVPAKPETLRWARELKANATRSVTDFNNQCYAYSGTSSNPLDSLCNSMNGMVKKTQSFLTLMEKVAGPGGKEFLDKQADLFLNGTVDDIMMVSDVILDKSIDTVKCANGDTAACNSQSIDPDLNMKLTGAMTFVTSDLKNLQGILPQVLKNLDFAKKEVSSVSGVITSVSQILGLKAPPLMEQISKLYKTLWIVYFVFFFLFSFGMLFYGFWSNGFFGGPQVEAAASSEPPQTFGQRLATCCSSCLACVRGCTSGHLCFWSMLLLGQILVLVLFLVSLVICLITGLQAFLGAGCSKVYLLGDQNVCSAVLSIFQIFLKTFGFNEPFADTCVDRNLMTCKVIRDATARTALVAIIGGLLASVFSFQMLLDSATKHERARCIRVMQEEGLMKEE